MVLLRATRKINVDDTETTISQRYSYAPAGSAYPKRVRIDPCGIDGSAKLANAFLESAIDESFAGSFRASRS